MHITKSAKKIRTIMSNPYLFSDDLAVHIQCKDLLSFTANLKETNYLI